jgi:hypothetical protein
MKSIITFTFLLFSYLGFSQATREVVVERNYYGQKLVVNTYTGTGNSEKLVKRTWYGSLELIEANEDGHRYWQSNSSDYFQTSIKPIQIETFGSFKADLADGKGEYYLTELAWGVIKRQVFNREGKLYLTWVITDNNDDIGQPYSVKYTIVP